MGKKWISAALCLLLALTATGCGNSNQSYYEQAQLYLGSGQYELAELLFSQLGEYADSADYALYSAAVKALEDGDLALAKVDFELVAPFKSSSRYLTYIEALSLEQEGSLEAAFALWQALGSFEDSAEHAAALMETIPAEDIAHAKALMKAGRYEQARTLLASLNGFGESGSLIAECDEAILRAAYDRAEALYAKGQFEEAMSAFEALGDSLDAAQRALDCRAAMYDALEEDYAHASLVSAAELMDRYAEMEDYGESVDRLSALQTRYGASLALVNAAATMPWVTFGQYPTQESGSPAPVVWRLLALDGSIATLLCDSVIDALPATTMPALMLTADEQAAVISLSLPLLSDLTALTPADLRCAATPYALAQGVRRHNDQSALWWLGNPVGAGCNAIVWYNGIVPGTGVSATESAVGVRPLLRIDLDRFALTEGNGTIEEPFL